MLRKSLKMMVAGALGAMALVLAMGATGGAQDKKDKKEEKLPDISEIMMKGHNKTDGYIAKVRAAAKDGKWEEAQKYAKTLAFFGENLGKNKPPKGDAKSWEALTKKYAENTKLAYKGTEDKDAKAVNKGLGGINCGECHKLHK